PPLRRRARGRRDLRRLGAARRRRGARMSVPDLAALSAAGRARAAAHEQARATHAAERPARATPRRRDDELKELAAQGAALLSPADGAEATADEVAAWASETFGDLLAVACSMADLVLPHVVAQRAPWVDVLFLETGY